MIDTGFTGFLTIPPGVVAQLGLPFVATIRVTLADGSETILNVYRAAVLWDGEPRYVRATAADATPLVGMRLLGGYSLYVEVADGGQVVIRAVE